MLYGCDAKWWAVRGGVPGFAGLKLCQDADAALRFPDVHRVTLRHRDDMLVHEPGVIGSGGNSGFQAINLALQFGANPIVLLGFDMRIDQGMHWHGRHVAPLRNPGLLTVLKWRRALDAVAPQFGALRVSVRNVSLDSALTAYPKMTLADALAA